MNIKLTIDKNTINVDGVDIQCDVSPFIKKNRTFVPIRFVSEILGYNVDCDDKEKTVCIFDRKIYFDTMNKCAIDFYMHWNAMSIGMFREIGATIKQNEHGYFWDGVFIGKQKAVQEYKFDFKDAVAILHTHGGAGGSDYFSKEDMNLAKKHNMPIYMASPVGNCWIFDPNQKLTEKIWDGAPTDLRELSQYKKYDMKLNIKKFNEYFKIYHDLSDQPLGHIADYYNKMYSKGECYVLRVDADED